MPAFLHAEVGAEASPNLCIMFRMADSFELRNPSKPHSRLCGFFVF